MGRARFLLYTGFIIINRAAMGRARFLLCTGFIIIISFFNRVAMGRARFLLYTGFIINRAAMGRARFLLCTGFIFFFLFFFCRWPDPNLHSAKSWWRLRIAQSVMFTRQKLLKHQCTKNVTDIVLLIVYKIFFLFVISQRWIEREY